MEIAVKQAACSCDAVPGERKFPAKMHGTPRVICTWNGGYLLSWPKKNGQARKDGGARPDKRAIGEERT